MSVGDTEWCPERWGCFETLTHYNKLLISSWPLQLPREPQLEKCAALNSGRGSCKILMEKVITPFDYCLEIQTKWGQHWIASVSFCSTLSFQPHSPAVESPLHKCIFPIISLLGAWWWGRDAVQLRERCKKDKLLLPLNKNLLFFPCWRKSVCSK